MAQFGLAPSKVVPREKIITYLGQTDGYLHASAMIRIAVGWELGVSASMYNALPLILSPVAEEFRFLTKSKSLRFMYAMGWRMLPDNRDREFGVFLNKEEKLGNSFEIVLGRRFSGESDWLVLVEVVLFPVDYILINGLENTCFFLTDEKAFNLSDSFDCGIIGSETRYDELNFPFHL